MSELRVTKNQIQKNRSSSSHLPYNWIHPPGWDQQIGLPGLQAHF